MKIRVDILAAVSDRAKYDGVSQSKAIEQALIEYANHTIKTDYNQDIQTEKRCTGCKQIKPLSQFNRARLQRLGRQNRCKTCCKKYRFDRKNSYISSIP